MPTTLNLSTLVVAPREPDAPDDQPLLVALLLNGASMARVLEADEPDDLAQIHHLASGRPVVTAAPHAALANLRALHVEPSDVWDVLDIFHTLFPDKPGETLAEVAAALDLPPEPRGTLGQATLTAAVFGALLTALEQTDPRILSQALVLGGLLPGWPLHRLLVEVERARTHAAFEGRGSTSTSDEPLWSNPASQQTRKRTAALKPRQNAAGLQIDTLLHHLEPGGTLSRAMPGYEWRPQQAEMVRAIGETLNAGGALLLEAGTGTGKSLGYLLPAASMALQNGWRIMVSTATTNLQDQLYFKDLPVVRQVLGDRLRATVLKGRANYLCLRRWQTALTAGDLDQDDRSLLLKTLFWLPRTQTGDRAELRLTPGEERAWGRLSAISEVCTPTKCGYHRAGVCFLARARRAAEESHIVIANHALLLSDLAAGSRVLPEVQVLVVDEAHHLEDEATAQLGWQLSEREALGHLDHLWNGSPSLRGADALVAQGLGALRKAGGSALADLKPLDERAGSELRLALRLLFQRLGSLLTGGAASTDDGAALRLTPAVRRGPLWEEVEELAERVNRAILSVASDASILAGKLHELPTDEPRDVAGELDGQLEYWNVLRDRLAGAIQRPEPSMVYWLTLPLAGAGGGAGAEGQSQGQGRGTAGARLNAAPIEVASILRDELFARPEAVVAVSATLAVDGGFRYVKQRLGLDAAREHVLGSPFDYQQAALLYVPHDQPDPTQPGYQPALERTLFDTIHRVGGRTLVLFTSRNHLRTTYQALRSPLARVGITLLGQDQDQSSRTRLLDAFRHGDRVALFGTSSFWEGIDVVGAALSCVVIVRLPFAVPTDPITAARSELFEDPFAQYSVPQAVLRLKQGFGRLIRSSSDRGAVVIMDKRLVTRGYGQVFLRSLPPCRVEQGPASRTAPLVERWLAREPGVADTQPQPDRATPANPRPSVGRVIQPDTLEDQLQRARRLARRR